MAKFKGTRAQMVDGEPLAVGATIEIDPARVRYLIDRGYLVKVEEAPKKTRSRKKAPTKETAPAETGDAS